MNPTKPPVTQKPVPPVDTALAGHPAVRPSPTDYTAGKEPRREGRRSQRVHISMPVLVYGNRKQDEPFQEEAHTVVVNAHGGLIALATPVVLDQKLLLINVNTMEELACSVVYLGATEEGKTHVAVEFSKPSPRFWHIAFPPEDWDPADRKRPQQAPRR